MALRLLMYIARVYEKMFKPGERYSSKYLSIPQPEFFVLYNGTAPFPDQKTIKLSESFYKAKSPVLRKKRLPALELEVRVININEGRNMEHRGRTKSLV